MAAAGSGSLTLFYAFRAQTIGTRGIKRDGKKLNAVLLWLIAVGA